MRLALEKQRDRLVVVHGEANAHAYEQRAAGDPELLQLVAERVATGERYEAVVVARRPLAASVPAHLELPVERFADGEPVARALERFAAFLHRDDRLCSWGRFTLDLLRAERFPSYAFVNLREAAARALERSPGGPESAATLLAGDAGRAPWTDGRAGRRLAALASIVERLLVPTDER
jgi:DTW domain-containing protein